MSGSSKAAATGGNGPHTPAWEAAGLELSDSGPKATKNGGFIPMGSIGTVGNGNGFVEGGLTKKFITGSSQHNPKAFSRCFGEYKPHSAPSMRMMADASPKKPTTFAAPDPLKIEGGGFARNGKGKVEPTYGLKEPGEKTLLVKGKEGPGMPFKVSAIRTGDFSEPVQVGKNTYYIKKDDATDFKFAQHIAAKNGGRPTLKVT